jgi:hypothetical protein
MPKPTKGETKANYIKRSIPIFIHEGYDRKEAVGRAYGFWDTYGNKSGAEMLKHLSKRKNK